MGATLLATPVPPLLRALAGPTAPQPFLDALAEHRSNDAVRFASAFVTRFPQRSQALDLATAADFLAGRLPQAEHDARQALALNSADAVAHRNLGIVLWHEHRIDTAGVELLHSAQQAPGDPLTQLYLGQWWFAGHNCPNASAAFNHASALLPEMPAAILMATRCDLDTNQPDAALRHLRMLGEPAPAPPQALLALAAEANDQGHYRVAEAALRRTPPNFPDRQTHDLNLAIASAQAGDSQTALPLLHKLVREGKANAEAWDLLGNLIETQGIDQRQPALVQQAYEAYRKAIFLDPHQIVSFADIARLSLKLGNYDLAENLLTEGLKQNPQASPLLLLRGVSYAFSSHAQQAAADFAQARQLDPSNPVSYLSQGLLELQQAHFAAASTVLRQGLRDSRLETSRFSRSWLYFLLASALYKQTSPPASPDEMEQAIRQSVELQPGFAEAWGLAGRIEEKLGNVQPAQDAFTTAHRLDPHNSHYVYELAMLHRRQGDQKAAAEEFRRFRELEETYDAARVHKYLMRIVVAPQTPAPSAAPRRESGS